VAIQRFHSEVEEATTLVAAFPWKKPRLADVAGIY
jgi:hypothetical protein